jgi:hypothetical protein
MTTRSVLWISLTFSLVAAQGCSWEPPRYAVAGAVTIDGVPAPYVNVVFRPVSSNVMAGGRGATDAAGKFKIGEDGKNTGFPKGDYKVTFSQTLVNGKPTLAGGGGKKNPEETVASEREAVADDFRDAEKTPVTATVTGGPNGFTFDIKKK